MKNGVAWKLFGAIATLTAIVFALLTWQGNMRARTQASQAREQENQYREVARRLGVIENDIAALRRDWTTWRTWWTNEAGSEGTGIPAMDATQNKQIEFLLEMERRREKGP